ncbi:ABC transporter permease [Ruegeria sp. HKCCD8929]|uniref:ABC transporter permease n=1 Tax=Ruegeria sp. HKCCD8929 TaxID=2683006 RepID=UPI0014876616|nr:ABC transporter permease [Ruegeria sp. HKCCD8929]
MAEQLLNKDQTKVRPKRRRLPANLIVGGMIAGIVVFLSFLAPLLAPYPYDQMHVESLLQPPSAEFWFGTDEFGRDIFSRVLIGALPSLTMGILATGLSLLIGVPIGLAAGYNKGRIDEIVMRTMDLIMSFPPIILAMLIFAVTPPSIWKAAGAIGLVWVPVMVRVTRSVTLDLMQEEFIQAARARGEKVVYILIFEILPNAYPIIIVQASIRVTLAILLAGTLSFLGFGGQPPRSDWGLMISEARPFLDAAPWIAIAPGLAMSFTVIGVNLFGDGLRELFDPRLRGRGRS